jgi:hypothetical protein
MNANGLGKGLLILNTRIKAGTGKVLCLSLALEQFEYDIPTSPTARFAFDLPSRTHLMKIKHLKHFRNLITYQ